MFFSLNSSDIRAFEGRDGDVSGNHSYVAEGNGAAYIEFDLGAPAKFFRVCQEIYETKAADRWGEPRDLDRPIPIVIRFDFVSYFL